MLITDGPYLEAKEHMGRFSVLEVAELNEALAWGARPPSPAGRRLKYASLTEAAGPVVATLPASNKTL